jgi:WD40 repeat protein/tetratricopeptide (TPR) repeat protein
VSLGRVVALKMILHAGHAGADERRRFQAEAEAVARLQHPHVVQVFEVGEHRGLPFFSLEYCPGGSLADQLDGTPRQPREAAALVRTLAGAVQAAHDKGIVHRDLKPGNVLLAEDGTPKVTDFGLAKRLDTRGQTQTGAVVGTPSYMAPEQAGGKKDVGPAADVYALGAILYELLTGRPPFKAASALETLLQVQSDEPVPVRRLQPKVPRDLETVVLKCLEKESKKRYASAGELAEDLRRFGSGEPVAARPVGWVGRTTRLARRPAVAGLLAAVGLVFAVGLGGVLWAYGEAVHESQAARTAERATQQEAEKVRQQKQIADNKAEEALREARRAEREVKRADEQARQARRQTYWAQIGRADAQLLAGEHEAAAEVLEGVGLEQRGWEYRYLLRRTEGTPLPLTLRGDTNVVSSVCYSPDGGRLATASVGEVKVWDTRTGTLALTLGGHTGHVRAVCYSPDGSRLACASGDTTVRVWDAHTGAPALTLRGHTREVRSVAYSPDGSRLASASGDQTVKVWDARTGAEALTLRGQTREVTAVSYSPDGSRLASASWDTTVKVWDARTGALALTLRGHTGQVNAVSYSPDGTRLASAAGDITIRVWDARTGALALTLRGLTGLVSSVSYSPDGTRLASASPTRWRDHTVKVWDAHTGAEALTLRGHTGQVRAVSYSPDGSRLASASEDGTVKVWDARTGVLALTLRGHTGPVTSVCYNPDGSRLASASSKTVKVWDARTGAEVLTLRGHTGAVSSVCYSPDGTRLASASYDQTVKVWDTRTGAEALTLRGHTGGVLSVCYSSDGTRLASASQDGTIKVWDARTGDVPLTLRGHTNGPRAVSYSPDGSRLASASEDGTVKVWDARTGVLALTLRGHTNTTSGVCYSPDGSRLASASWDHTVKVWDAHTGEPALTLRGHTNRVLSVVYSPDGGRLASAAFDKTVKVWDARTGAEVLTLRGHTGPVTSVYFSPDGTSIISQGILETIVWDAATGERLPGQPVRPPALAPTVSPDGRFLAVLRGEVIQIHDRRPTSGYDPWGEDFDRRAALAPTWHAQDAEDAEHRSDWFAAAFHRRLLVRLRPEEPEHRLDLARALWHLGRWKDALDTSDDVLRRLRPEEPEHRLDLARALWQFGRWQDALDTCDDVLRRQPDLAPAYLARAGLRRACGDRAGADADSLAALALAGSSRTGWPTFARREAQAGERAAAQGDWARAREHFGLAVLWQASEPEAAPMLGVNWRAEANPKFPGVKILSVADGSNAEELGLEVGDSVLTINGKQVATSKEATGAVQAANGKFSMLVKDIRTGDLWLITADIDEATKGFAPGGKIKNIERTKKSTEGPAGYVGVALRAPEDGGGLVVVRVLDGGPAKRAGVKVGDVLLKVGDQEAWDLQAAVRMMRKARPGSELTLRIRRGGKEENITVRVGVLPSHLPP